MKTLNLLSSSSYREWNSFLSALVEEKKTKQSFLNPGIINQSAQLKLIQNLEVEMIKHERPETVKLVLIKRQTSIGFNEAA